MVLFVSILVLLAATVECNVELQPPPAASYNAKYASFCYLTGNYTAGQQKTGVFQILEMNLTRHTWVILYTKPDANKVGRPPCEDEIQSIPHNRILKVYNNHTVKDSKDTPDTWNIVNNTVVCYQVLQQDSYVNWGSFRYKYEDSCSKKVTLLSQNMSPYQRKSVPMKTYRRCYPMQANHSTVVDFQTSLKNATSLSRVIVTYEKSVYGEKCYQRNRYVSGYGWKDVTECSITTITQSEFLQITGQSPAKFLLDRWPLVVTNSSEVCFEYQVVDGSAFEENVLFKVSEFPTFNGNVTNRTGILVSPGYPTTLYPNNTDCTWTLKVKPGQKILVKFGDTVSDCGNDYLMLSGVEGDSNNKELLCGGSVTGRSFISKANKLTVRFKTNSFKKQKGFLMNYTVIGCSLQNLKFTIFSRMINPPNGFIPPGYSLRVGCKPGTVFPSKVADITVDCTSNNTWSGNIPYCIGYTMCNETLTDPVGYVSSPGYPHPYPKDAICHWTINVKKGQTILIKIEDIKSICMNDYIVISGIEQKKTSKTTTTTKAPGNKSRTKRSTTSQKAYICGDTVSAGKEYTSVSNNVTIFFQSDVFQDNGYFKMSYKALGCSTDDLKMPVNALLKNPAPFYPVDFKLTVVCSSGFSFTGASQVDLVCTEKGVWNGRIPRCVRWGRTGL